MSREEVKPDRGMLMRLGGTVVAGMVQNGAQDMDPPRSTESSALRQV